MLAGSGAVIEDEISKEKSIETNGKRVTFYS